MRSRPICENMEAPGSEADWEPTFLILVRAEPGTSLKTRWDRQNQGEPRLRPTVRGRDREAGRVPVVLRRARARPARRAASRVHSSAWWPAAPRGVRSDACDHPTRLLERCAIRRTGGALSRPGRRGLAAPYPPIRVRRGCRSRVGRTPASRRKRASPLPLSRRLLGTSSESVGPDCCSSTPKRQSRPGGSAHISPLARTRREGIAGTISRSTRGWSRTTVAGQQSPTGGSSRTLAPSWPGSRARADCHGAARAVARSRQDDLAVSDTHLPKAFFFVP
jgi:hypothetical protein